MTLTPSCPTHPHPLSRSRRVGDDEACRAPCPQHTEEVCARLPRVLKRPTLCTHSGRSTAATAFRVGAGHLRLFLASIARVHCNMATISTGIFQLLLQGALVPQVDRGPAMLMTRTS